VRYFIHLSYDGSRYHGWQIQPNGISIEGEIERCLSTLLGVPVDIVGAGRTDAGVHARHMVAHFDVEEPVADTSQLTYKLNRMLPPDIRIEKTESVPDDMHARFSAKWRTYHYYLSLKPTPFNRHYTWLCHYDLDFPLMNEAARMLMEYKDFACFCKSHTDVKTTLCDVVEAEWVKTGGSEWFFVIKANRFLRNMVRAVVGTLVEVGRHRMTLEQFRSVIEGKSRCQAGESMPANALFLEKIEY
jgi:tRNA pseudouridine38-40 synthase